VIQHALRENSIIHGKKNRVGCRYFQTALATFRIGNISYLPWG